MNVASEVEVLTSEFQSLKIVSLVIDEGLQNFAFFSPLIHVSTMRCSLDYVAVFRQHTSIMAGSKNRWSFLLIYNFSLHGFTLNMRQSFEQHASLISIIYQNLKSCLKQKKLWHWEWEGPKSCSLHTLRLMVNLSALFANVVIFLSMFFLCKSSALVCRAK